MNTGRLIAAQEADDTNLLFNLACSLHNKDLFLSKFRADKYATSVHLYSTTQHSNTALAMLHYHSKVTWCTDNTCMRNILWSTIWFEYYRNLLSRTWNSVKIHTDPHNDKLQYRHTCLLGLPQHPHIHIVAISFWHINRRDFPTLFNHILS
jgi:hypothetical protein